MSTSITVEFEINDLSSSYEVLGSSPVYSFQENLGFGYDLVDIEGDSFVTTIPLKGNYGVFDIRVFAVSQIGVKSTALLGSVEVLPSELDSTFTFSDIQISSNEYQDLQSEVIYSPQYDGDSLIVKSKFAGRSIKFDWSLIPPSGHKFEGSALSSSLLNDTLFSGFKINIKNDGQYLDLSQAGFSENSLNILTQSVQTQKPDIQDLFANYRNFSLDISDEVFNDLDLSRNVELEIVSVDKFGNQATGIVQVYNSEPVISNLSHSTQGSSTTFSWLSEDIDFKDVRIDVLAVPNGTPLPFDSDLQASAEYLKSVKEAKPYSEYDGAYFSVNDKVLYQGKVYDAIVDHSRSAEDTPLDDDRWYEIGDIVEFNYFSSFSEQDASDFNSLIQNNSAFSEQDSRVFNVEQTWGYDYYYTFQPIDEYGEGSIFNLTEKGLVNKLSVGSSLHPILVDVKIGNLRYRELGDDFVFNWDVLDQDDNLVDINQYKFLFGGEDTPSILGISGSLFDVHTNQKLTGITDGFNSKSLSYDEEGDLVVNANLPSTKVFDQYKYTRELNNQIYKTGGFPVDYVDYDISINFNSGDNAVVNHKLYRAYQDSNFEGTGIYPLYSKWDKSKTYSPTNKDCFEYNNSIYISTQSFGADSSSVLGLYSYETSYSVGDIVICPNKSIPYFSEDSSYSPGDLAFYHDSIYECIKNISSEEIYFPEDQQAWARLDIFVDLDCSYFESKNDNNSSYPFGSPVSWTEISPEYLASKDKFFSIVAPSYQLNLNNWNNQQQYFQGDIVLYGNDIWRALSSNISSVPGDLQEDWEAEADLGLYSDYYQRNYLSGDLIYSNNFIYKCIKDNPGGGPILSRVGAGDNINSSYESSNWVPFWEQDETYSDYIFGHKGIPQSGKRSIGLEIGIIDTHGSIIDRKTISADNPPPFILKDGFSVDSTSEATKIKFNFNYALSFQEKTSKVYLYRSSEPEFSIVDEDGFPLTGEETPFVKSVIGAGDATFGQNITEIYDSPPLYIDENGIEQITGYYYKILPFDDFGSGVLYEVSDNQGPLEKSIVYPSRYNNSNPNVMPGRVVRADPTQAAGAVPGPVIDLNGTAAFENFFLNWRAPGSEYEDGSTNLIKRYQNDIDYYEVWASDEEILYTGTSELNKNYWQQNENTGYRKFDGYFYSVGDIPSEVSDPALNIIGAQNIFNAPGNQSSIEVVYPGQTNDTKNFWVRAVDFAGNKSPFTGSSVEESDAISGITLSLAGMSSSDISDFEIGITEKFSNSIALIPSNPFLDNQPNPGSVSWAKHVLYYHGTGHVIDAGSTNSGYVWWDIDGDTLGEYSYANLSNIKYSGAYKVSDAHPVGGLDSNGNYISKNSQFEDDDFIVARNTNGTTSLSNHSMPNALIGTANIANSAIDTAKIKDLAVDNAKISSLGAEKISAGEIKSADIRIGRQSEEEAGVIRTEGFTSIDDLGPGFYLSGDGSFAFKGGQDNGSLSLDNGVLTLKGSLRQVNGDDYDFIEIDSAPSHFNYSQAPGYENGEYNENTFIPSQGSATELNITTTFRNSTVSKEGVRFRMDAILGNSSVEVFGYEDYASVGYNISGFVYDYSTNEGFQDSTETIPTKTAKAKLYLGNRNNQLPIENGFDRIIDEAFPSNRLADAVVIYASGINSSYEKSITISRLNDGTIGRNGQDGASVNIIFYRSEDPNGPSTPENSIDIPQGWSDSDPQQPGNLWASKGRTDIGSDIYVWSDPFRIDSSAIAEIYLYRLHDPNVENNLASPGDDSSFNFTTNQINLPSEGNWQASPPSLENNGDIVYVSVGLASGSPSDESASISWGQTVVFSQRTDGLPGESGGGQSPTYRGEYTSLKSYYFIPSSGSTPGRGDVVLYNGHYYICKKTHGPGTSSPEPRFPVDGQGNINDEYWIDFGAEFESVATNLLLTETAYITKDLVVGDGLSSGGRVMAPNNFLGSYNDDATLRDEPNYSPNGFKIARTDDNKVVFDLGSQEEFTYEGNNYISQSYFRFSADTGKIEFKGALESRTIDVNVARSVTLLNDGLSNLPAATFIGGGYNNSIDSSDEGNGMDSLASSIVAGGNNQIIGRFSLIGAGHANVCNDNFSAIVAGYNNSMPKQDDLNEGANFIGAGQNNVINGGTNQAIICGSFNSIISQ